ncbi:hypothetical protein EVB79_034 [Rhizobium phage RHph_N3_13]|nr:hypothetical protein EVB79_034 [Rhizobium phage RHph_N3_13]
MVDIIKIGADPEGWVIDGNGDFFPAFGVIPGDKENPYKVDGGAVQVDGLALEFNIDAATTDDEFCRNVWKVTSQLTEMVKTFDKSFTIQWSPVAKFRPTIWSIAPEQSKMLGCSPDYNVKGEINENPFMRLENNPLRTAAGHIHIGWLQPDEFPEDPTIGDHFDTCLDIAQGFFNGHLPSFVPQTPEEEERLEYYGLWGSFRPKRYGIELRAPSNLWVRSEETQRKIFNETRKHFNDLTGL